MGRSVHLVGSVPMANAQAVFETVSAALGHRIKRLPDGETGERADWITWLEPIFASNPAFERSGEFFRVHATGTGRIRYTLIVLQNTVIFLPVWLRWRSGRAPVPPFRRRAAAAKAPLLSATLTRGRQPSLAGDGIIASRAAAGFVPWR
jgi:hypothetical protein